MSIKSAQVTVGTTATELTGSDVLPGDGSSVMIKPLVDIFVGGSDVTAANGYLVEGGTPFSYDLGGGQPERLYAVVASGSTTVYVIRGGV